MPPRIPSFPWASWILAAALTVSASQASASTTYSFDLGPGGGNGFVVIDQAVPLSGTAIIGASDVEGQYGGFGFGYAFGNTDEYFDMYGFPLGPPVFSPSGPAAVTFQDGVPMGISYGEQHTKWELQHKEYIPVVIDFVYMSGGEFAINGGHGSIVFIVPVQEPSSLAMMVAGLGLLTLAGLRRMRR